MDIGDKNDICFLERKREKKSVRVCVIRVRACACVCLENIERA